MIPPPPSSAVTQQDTDTTSGSGSPEAANCRKLRKNNVESITLAWLLPHIPPEQLPMVPDSRWIQAGTMALSQEELSSHLACVSPVHTVPFAWILLNEQRL